MECVGMYNNLVGTQVLRKEYLMTLKLMGSMMTGSGKTSVYPILSELILLLCSHFKVGFVIFLLPILMCCAVFCQSSF